MKIKIIENDLFNIASRIKKIDKNYFIVFNYSYKRYEVHYKNQKGSSLCFVVDKPYLNSEVLTKAHKTSVRNYKALFKEILENNKTIENKSEEYINEKTQTYLKDYIKYADKLNCDYNFLNANKTLWV